MFLISSYSCQNQRLRHVDAVNSAGKSGKRTSQHIAPIALQRMEQKGQSTLIETLFSQSCVFEGVVLSEKHKEDKCVFCERMGRCLFLAMNGQKGSSLIS